jgi:hypothetical protein
VSEPMDDFERELREQLQVRPAPDGFAGRVMARVAARPVRRGWLGFGLPVWRWAVAALLVASMVLGGVERDRQQRLAGERARQQVLLALHITGSTLRDVQAKVSAGGDQRELNQKGAGRTVLEKNAQ